MTTPQRFLAAVVVLLALLVRIWALDWKPPHFDEGVNGGFVDAMRHDPAYRYNPANFHGPLHFYAMFASGQIFGRGVWSLRLPTVLVGVACVALVLAFRRFFSAWVVFVAAVAFAISPAMIFYARYAIHEMWLPFFAMLAIYGAFGVARGDRRRQDLWAIGIGITGMVLTKETYILHFAAAFLAWLFGREKSERVKAEPQFSRQEILQVAGVCLAVLVTLYSGMFYYWPGVAGIFETFRDMAAKGWSSSEEGHHKEMLYYPKLLGYYEWPALIGLAIAPVLALKRSRLAGACAVVAGLLLQIAGIPWSNTFSLGVCLVLVGVCWMVAKPLKCPLMRFLALYGLASVAAYSFVSYKTPWCVINLLWPFYFVLGHCFSRLVQFSHASVVLLLGATLSAAPLMDSWRINFINPTSPKEPYIYVQQLRDLEMLTKPVERVIAADPSRRLMTGIIIHATPQPLPWVLPDLPNVAVWSHEKELHVADADFLLVHESRVEEVEAVLLDVYFRSRFRFFFEDDDHRLYLRASVFAEAVEPGRVPEFRRRIRLEDSAE